MSDLTPEMWIALSVILFCVLHTAFSYVRSFINWLVSRYRKHGYVHNEVNDLLWKIGRPSAGQSGTTRIAGEDFEIIIKQWRKGDETTQKPKV